MTDFSGYLICSDIDGTISVDTVTVPENIHAIKYFTKNGGRFTIATGRTAAYLKRLDFFDCINAPACICNGSVVYDYKKEEIVFVNSIDSENAEALRNIYRMNAPLSMELYSVDHKAYVLTPDKRSIEHFRGLEIPDYTVITEISEEIFPLVKVMLSVGERTAEVQNNLSNTEMMNMCFIPCDGPFVEILSKEAGKGKALHQLARFYGFDKNNVYAVGDGSNDTDMLMAAEIGFVPENGSVLAKKVADKTVCSSDDGAVAGVIAYLDTVY